MGKIIYSAITWVDEDKELGKEYISWLEEEHLPELSLQPGFNSVKRVKLEEMNTDKWQGYQIIMEVNKRADLENYFNSTSRTTAFIPLNKFANVHRAERYFGELDIYLKK